MMLHMDAVVKDLAEPDADRFQDTEETVQGRGTEVRVMNEVVRDAVDVPGDADRVDKPEDQHDPERRVREKEEHPEEIGEMEQLRCDGDNVPAGEGKNTGIGLESLGGDVVNGVHGSEM